jgi:hypothetical protein
MFSKNSNLINIIYVRHHFRKTKRKQNSDTKTLQDINFAMLACQHLNRNVIPRKCKLNLFLAAMSGHLTI